MSGRASAFDLFDYKPELVKWNDKLAGRIPQRPAICVTSGDSQKLMVALAFRQYGKAGMWMSDAVPNLSAAGR